MTISLLPSVSAAADPGPTEPISEPDTAAEARAAWMSAEEQAEQFSEDLLQANINVESSAAVVVAADAAVVTAEAQIASADAASAAAEVAVADHNDDLDAFVSASFRGARTSSLNSLLTAGSPDDYLDSLVALDRVAAAQSLLLDQAEQARDDAAAAAAEAVLARSAAAAAREQAIAAQAAAVQAQADAAAMQAQFDAQIAEYETLYNRLTEEERLAAIAAEEERLAAEAAAAAAADPADVDAAVIAASIVTPGTPETATPGDVAGPLTPAPNAAAQAAVEAALSKVGSKYVFGAAGPNQFDCSGLTSWAWKQAGVTIPRTSRGQSALPVVPLDQLRPGDLITFYSPVSHVAMYIGDGQMVQASTASKPVYVTSLAKGGPNPVGHRVG